MAAKVRYGFGLSINAENYEEAETKMNTLLKLIRDTLRVRVEDFEGEEVTASGDFEFTFIKSFLIYEEELDTLIKVFRENNISFVIEPIKGIDK